VEQAGAVARYADGVIIGSSLVDMVQESANVDEALPKVRAFLEEAGTAVRTR
jgi:tryptophan synthase alpha subunit